MPAVAQWSVVGTPKRYSLQRSLVLGATARAAQARAQVDRSVQGLVTGPVGLQRQFLGAGSACQSATAWRRVHSFWGSGQDRDSQGCCAASAQTLPAQHATDQGQGASSGADLLLRELADESALEGKWGAGPAQPRGTITARMDKLQQVRSLVP